MADDSRVLQLLEEAMQSGRTPEDVCADSPELLATVRNRLEKCRRLGLYIQDLFPSGNPSASTAPDGRAPGPGGEEPDLPTVPGYAIESVLGRGGMGVVYRALDLRLKRSVALKMLLSGAYAARAERARFMREARAIAALRHPNVVQVYDVGEQGGRSYFTMELMDGGSLAQRLGLSIGQTDVSASVNCVGCRRFPMTSTSSAAMGRRRSSWGMLCHHCSPRSWVEQSANSCFACHL